MIAVPGAGGAESPYNPPPTGYADAPPPTIDAPADQAAPRTVTPPRTDPKERLLSPQQVGRQGVIKGVAEQPLRDLNLMQSRIPPVLQAAMADPYERAWPPTCEGITAQIARLDAALGPDLDQPVSTDHPSMLVRGEDNARDYGLDAMRAGVQSYIPFDRYIRLVTGADRHDRRVMAAIQAGAIRRAYLKGLGEVRGCAPPAVPRHLAHPVRIASDADGKPRAR
ncbi:MAG TPA: hypothetical protein VGG29_00275 [Caulobacteraceae bacterium]